MIRRVSCHSCGRQTAPGRAVLVGDGFRCGRCSLVTEIASHLDAAGGATAMQSMMFAVTLALWSVTGTGLFMIAIAVLR